MHWEKYFNIITFEVKLGRSWVYFPLLKRLQIFISPQSSQVPSHHSIQLHNHHLAAGSTRINTTPIIDGKMYAEQSVLNIVQCEARTLQL